MKNLTLNYFAFFFGFILELLLITGSPIVVLKVLFWGVASSVLGFFPGRSERVYSFQDRLEFWPIGVIFTTLVAALIFLRKYLLTALHEGASLLLAIAYTYWIAELGRDTWLTPTQQCVLLIPCLPIFFSAFTYVELGSGLRITLSLISSLIAVAFGATFLVSIVELQNAEHLLQNGYAAAALQVLIQHLFLGASLVYVSHQILLLLYFIPNRGAKRYFEEVNLVMEEHLSRYSPEQMPIWLAFLTIAGAGGFFLLNYSAELIPYRMAISLVLIVGSFLLALVRRIVYPPVIIP